MTQNALPSPSKRLAETVAACRAALPLKRDVIMRVCVRHVRSVREGIADLSDPRWRVWDGTRRGLISVLASAGVETKVDAQRAQISLHATHNAVSFEDAIPASRDVTDIVRQLVPG